MELAWEGDMTRTVQHVGGQLGALARVGTSASGKLELFPIESGTLAGLDWCTFDQDRGVCPLPESSYLLVRGSTVTQKPWPAGSAKPALLRVFGRSGIVAVDRNGLVWISLDDGATWKSHSWLALKEPMRVNEYDTQRAVQPGRLPPRQAGLLPVFAGRSETGVALVCALRRGRRPPHRPALRCAPRARCHRVARTRAAGRGASQRPDRQRQSSTSWPPAGRPG